MASTYVNDLRLNEMATGDESGNWGVVTNLNLELIGEALGYGTEGITTNADTHTTTVADGATDPGRAMYIEYTGTLDSACTITIAPNTLNRMHFIENGTSGSQNIIISQGSGANITIPPGDTKAVYLDGAGSGAAVVDAFASLNVVDLKVQDDLTVTDDATIGGTLGVTGIVTLTDDLIIGDGKTIGSASDVDAITIAANGQLTLTQTLIGTALDISGDIDVDGTSNLDIVDIDGAVDMASTLAVAGVVTANAGVVVDNITIDGTEIDLSSGNLTLDVAGEISIDSGDGVIRLKDGGTQFGAFIESSNAFIVKSQVNDGDLIFKGVDNSSEITALSLDMSAAGAATFNSTINGLTLAAGSIATSTSQNFALNTPNSLRINIDSNDSATDQVFVVGHNRTDVGTTSSLLVIQENGNVGIGTTSPSQKLHVVGKIKLTDDLIIGGTSPRIDYDGGSTGALRFFSTSANTERMRLTSSGRLCLGFTDVQQDAFVSIISNGSEGLFNGVNSSNAYRRYFHTVSDGIHRFEGSANTATITNAGAWQDASDVAYKEDIQDISYGLDAVKALRPRKYKMKGTDLGNGEGLDQKIGFIAQEAELVVPEVVDGKDGEKTLGYGQLTAVLVKAIQELETRITTLEG